jgi:CBS-domain-containing membrane protein
VSLLTSRNHDLITPIRVFPGALTSIRLQSSAGRFTSREVMKTDLVLMRPRESAEQAVDLLGDGGIHSVLIVGESDQLVGIATNPDLLKFLFA